MTLDSGTMLLVDVNLLHKNIDRIIPIFQDNSSRIDVITKFHNSKPCLFSPENNRIEYSFLHE